MEEHFQGMHCSSLGEGGAVVHPGKSEQRILWEKKPCLVGLSVSMG